MNVYADSLKYLLNPLGHLFLMDTLPGSRACGDEKFMRQWRAVLLKSGFVFCNRNETPSETPEIIARVEKPLKYPKRVTLVIPDGKCPLVNAVATSLQDNGIVCDRLKFKHDLPQAQDIISLVDFGQPALYTITEARFREFVNCLSKFKCSIIWVTPSAQLTCTNPNSSMILGMTRTLRAELKKDITVVEIDEQATTFPSSSRLIVEIYQNLQYRAKRGVIDPDYEFAIANGVVKIPRVHWTTGVKELSQCTSHSVTDEHGWQRLQAPDQGLSTSIRFQSDACYVLSGGLGGLGRVVSSWMVENGARSILFISRSAKESPDTTPFFDELRAQGCEVLAFSGSVSNLDDVGAAIELATRPIRGVMQMSAVMRVCLIHNRSEFSLTLVG